MAGIIDINWLYFKYYSEYPELRHIVISHSEAVAKKALEINRRKHLGLSPHDVYLAAMLHDIGVVKCNAPEIHAFGNHPYLQHGIEGKMILEKNGLEKYAKICSTHTGAGITAAEIKEKNLPLPERDLLPHTLLEKLICYADKFFSKSNKANEEKSIEEVESQMKKYGPASYQRFIQLKHLFEDINK